MKFKLKFKLNRSAWLLLASGLFAIIAVFLLLNYLTKVAERDSLLADIDKVRLALPKATTEMRNLEPQLTQTASKVTQSKATFDKIKASFPEADAAASGEQLLKLADNNSLRVVNIQAGDPAEDKHDDITFIATNIDVGLKGKPEDILAFVHSLLTSQTFMSSFVNQLSTTDMDQPEASLHISMVVYSYKGS